VFWARVFLSVSFGELRAAGLDSLAAPTINLACSSRALALRAVFGEAKSPALVKSAPNGRLVGRPNSAPDHGDLATKKGPT